MKQITTKRRLYRALRRCETILTSNLVENHKLKKDINFLNEIYSHIMPTYKFRESRSFRTVFSFTEDVDIAKKLLQNHPETYFSIGYIDIEITNSFATNRDDILFIIPAFRIKDWIELIAYDFESNNAITNLNYNCPVNFINTIIPSRWSARSLAYSAKEYILICNQLTPTLMSDYDITNASNPFPNEAMDEKDFLIRNYQNNILAVAQLQQELKPLKLSKNRKEYLEDELKKLLIYYKNKIA